MKGFYHIWAWRPSWSCDLDFLYIHWFPLPIDASYKIWLWLAKRFQRRRSLKLWTDDGRTTDGRTPDHGHPISSPCGGTPVKKYHSAVPHENSAFKNFIHTCLMLNSENISYILCKISHLLQSIAIIRHVSAQITMPKWTISHRRLLFVHYPLLKSGPF